jgi:hypothetical protein
VDGAAGVAAPGRAIDEPMTEEPTTGSRLRRRVRHAILPACALALAACATTGGEPPRIQAVEQFRVGVTMRADAERLLGPAQYASEEPEGRTALYWAAGPSGPQVPGGAARMVKLVFGKDGRLARPAETVYPSRPDPSGSGSALAPAHPLPR